MRCRMALTSSPSITVSRGPCTSISCSKSPDATRRTSSARVASGAISRRCNNSDSPPITATSSTPTPMTSHSTTFAASRRSSRAACASASTSVCSAAISLRTWSNSDLAPLDVASGLHRPVRSRGRGRPWTPRTRRATASSSDSTRSTRPSTSPMEPRTRLRRLVFRRAARRCKGRGSSSAPVSTKPRRPVSWSSSARSRSCACRAAGSTLSTVRVRASLSVSSAITVDAIATAVMASRIATMPISRRPAGSRSESCNCCSSSRRRSLGGAHVVVSQQQNGDVVVECAAVELRRPPRSRGQANAGRCADVCAGSRIRRSTPSRSCRRGRGPRSGRRCSRRATSRAAAARPRRSTRSPAARRAARRSSTAAGRTICRPTMQQRFGVPGEEIARGTPVRGHGDHAGRGEDALAMPFRDQHLVQRRAAPSPAVRRRAPAHATRSAGTTPSAASSGPCPQTSPMIACTVPSGRPIAS